MAHQTTLDEWAKDPVVDPEVRAHVYSLITALGGTGDDGTYALGDDALLCLKDLRRWLKFVDAKLNRHDVARSMAEANLVKGDLLEILAKVSEKLIHDKLKYKIALACLELLVHLTWPFEIDPDQATADHYRHGPYLQLAQIGYKRAILQFDRARILQTAVRIALPSMTVPLRERSPRDEGIIRIALYFIRNIAMLSPPNNVPTDIDEAEISRSTTIDTFHEQDIFQVLLTVASNIGEDFVEQDVAILEILFYLLKGVEVEKLFMTEKDLTSKNTDELKNLIQKEKSMLAGYARHAPTRHNRFGTMVWVKRDDDKVSTLSGQDFLGKTQRTMQKMDTTKKWNKPKWRGRKKDNDHERDEFDLPVALTSSARKHLTDFVEEFLDSSFNPLFMHLRKAIEREAERVETRHSRQYFYLVSWFLRAECARRRMIKERAADPRSAEVLTAEDESYGLVAEVMNQETFILLNRYMQRSQDEKAWQDLNAGMKCFTQILLTVQEMSESALEEDQEIAENIQNRIFYEESTHDRIVHILRDYKHQGFGYLDACTELSHVFLRMLERYAKQNVDLQVRSRRRARKIRKKQAQAQGVDDGGKAHVSETEDIAAAQRTTSERKFDFARFAAKFVNQSSVNTFISFLRYYRDLDTEQLKRAHRFFYRVTFKMELGVLLYRVDILQIFYKMIKGPEGLDSEAANFKEWEEFIRHFFRTVVKRVQDRPELIVEMLFSKIPATLFFLEHGYDRVMPTRAPRAPAEVEVKPGMEKPEQIGVAVGVLVNQNKSDAIQWVRDVLSSALEERKAWEAMEEARKQAAAAALEGGEADPSDVREGEQEAETVKPPSILVKADNEDRQKAMFKDNKLRLLMTLVGFSRLGADDDPDATWVIPSSLTAAELSEAIDLIRKFEFDPPVYEDGKTAQDFIRYKTTATRRSTRKAEFDDDSDGIDDDSEEDRGEYAPDRLSLRKSEGKKTLKRRRRAGTPRELDDEEKDRRAKQRRQKELEKQRKIKSTIFVHDSDDEDDEERDKEFFAREQALRERTLAQFKQSLALDSTEPASSRKRKGDAQAENGAKRRKTPPKRRAGPFDTDESDDEGASDNDVVSISSRATSQEAEDVLDTSSEKEASDTPLSSQHAPTGDNHGGRDGSKITPAGDMDSVMVDVDDEDEDAGPTVRRAPTRTTRGGFIIDDSDSE
ncbi:topoisomerase 1-associated factor 1 [Westerdykella ornata]|uniref:Topoisomerase 1-associated factor 1 n=1 Tax=Westerdykella ornata TaxID=318751 RepID=A0A6A6JV98_WESOR|nr:topoisomerase 1-associated factor 1 [Westerdykella ornata]KAF2280144.1 topoisomerase 1-associated factor 1 [Westerdykella ornata]